MLRVIDTTSTEIRSDIKNRTEYSLDARIVCISEQHNRSNCAFFFVLLIDQCHKVSFQVTNYSTFLVLNDRDNRHLQVS